MSANPVKTIESLIAASSLGDPSEPSHEELSHAIDLLLAVRDAGRREEEGEVKTTHHQNGSEHTWSIPSAATDPETVPERKFYRLFVRIDHEDDGLVHIEDLRVTSGSEHARIARDTTNRCISLTPIEAEWLLSVLPGAMMALKVAELGLDRVVFDQLCQRTSVPEHDRPQLFARLPEIKNMASSSKILAIKLVRSIAKIDLKSAKDLVEGLPL